MDHNSRLETPEIKTTPIALAVRELIVKHIGDNDSLTIDNLNSLLFGDKSLVPTEDMPNLVNAIYTCQTPILVYLKDLTLEVCDATARAILELDTQFFKSRYSGKLEIHGETGQITDNLSSEDLENLSKYPYLHKIYLGIQPNPSLIFALKRAVLIVSKVKPVEEDWIANLLDF